MKKLLLTTILCSAFAMLLSACGGGATATHAGGDDNVISFFNMMVNPDEDANSRAFYARMDDFAEAFPDVTIDMESIPHDDYETLLMIYIASGDLPDVFQAKGTLTAQLAADGLVHEATTLLDMIPGWLEQYQDGVFEDYLYDGRKWATPFQIGNNHNIFWNSELFAEVGLNDFPDTWEGFLDAIELFIENDIIPISLGNLEQWPAPSLTFNTLVYRFNSPEWYFSVRDGTGAQWTDPGFILAAQTMRDLVVMGAFNEDFNSIDIRQQRTLFYNRQAAMMVDGFWGVAIVESEAPEDVVAATRLAQLPAIPEAMGGTGVGNVNQAAAGWAYFTNINVTGDRLELVANMLYHLTNSEFANIVVANSGMPAANPTFIDEDALSPLYLELLRINAESTYAPVFDSQLAAEIVDVFYSNLQEVLIGTMTPERYAELLQAETDANRLR